MSLIRFADFVADARTAELRRAGARVRLPPQSFQVLMSLTRAPGELVTREALQAELWPATSPRSNDIEWEQGLNAAINRLREALGDSAASPKFIETLPRRGYRFIGTLLPEPAGAAESGGLTTTPQRKEAVVEGTAADAARGMRQPPRRRGGLIASIIVSGTLGTLALFSAVRNEQDAPAGAGRLVPVTALPGEERGPGFSPDGTRLVFAWNGDTGSKGAFDLYVKALDAEPLLRLTRVPAQALRAAWSPDGKSIAFTRRIPGGQGVFVVPAMGGAERRVATAAFASNAFMQLSWSPDGHTIAYASFDGSGSHVIRFVNTESLAQSALAQAPECWNAGLPAYSADGKRFAFVCNTSIGVYGVWVATFDGKPPARLATLFGEAEGLSWDADQTSLIVANDAGDGGGLWRLAPGGALTRLPFGEEGSGPVVSGARVAYVRARQPVDIWRMDLKAADPATTATRHIYSTRREMTPQYSADGARIAFQSNRSGSTEIWMVDADGANPVRLTQLNGPMAGAPQWCADGKQLAFDSRAAGSPAIYVMNVDERKARRLGPADAALSLPTWSEDCRSILASDGRVSLYEIDVAGGSKRLFTRQMSYLAYVIGTRALFNVKRPDRVELWSRALEGGAEQPLPGMPPLDYDDAWAVTPAGIYFTSLKDGAPAISYYDFAGQTTRRIAALGKAPLPGGGLGIAVSRDGRWLLYTQPREAESDIMLMDSPG